MSSYKKMESKIVKEPHTVQQWGTHHLFPVQARDMTYKLLFYLFWNCRIGYTLSLLLSLIKLVIYLGVIFGCPILF